MIRIKAPEGNKLRDIKTGAEYSEVVIKEKDRDRFVLVNSEEDPNIEVLNGVTLNDRVSDLEDAVIELAEIIAGEE